MYSQTTIHQQLPDISLCNFSYSCIYVSYMYVNVYKTDIDISVLQKQK